MLLMKLCASVLGSSSVKKLTKTLIRELPRGSYKHRECENYGHNYGSYFSQERTKKFVLSEKVKDDRDLSSGNERKRGEKKLAQENFQSVVSVERLKLPVSEQTHKLTD